MNNSKQLENEQSLVTSDNTVREIRAGSMSMIVGVSNRLTGVFVNDEDECEVPEDFKPAADEYESWLG